jgi:hypothetical protein
MSAAEVKNIAVDWAQKEGWNPGFHDSTVFYQTDPNGFFVGLLDNTPVACISTVSYDESFCFLGFYIVKEEFRGKGYGLNIWKKAMDYIGTHNVGLDGVVAQQSNYMKSGFKFAYSNIRYEGIVSTFSNNKNEIIAFSDDRFEELVKYDRRLFPALRTKFLSGWVKLPEAETFLSFANKEINGYATVRKCNVGYKIGPLFANDTETASALFAATCNFAGAGSTIYLDTPEVNLNAVALAENYGMKKVFETARMYTKERPGIDMSKIFGVTTFELG